MQIYSWMDATLRELSDLIKEASPAARDRNSQLSFAIVYPGQQKSLGSLLARTRGWRLVLTTAARPPADKRGTMTLKEVGEHLKLTRERVRQIEAEALRKLERHLASRADNS